MRAQGLEWGSLAGGESRDATSEIRSGDGTGGAHSIQLPRCQPHSNPLLQHVESGQRERERESMSLTLCRHLRNDLVVTIMMMMMNADVWESGS